MRSRDAIKVTMTTTGSVTSGPATLSGGYRWHKTPGWRPDDPRVWGETAGLRGREVIAAMRAERLAGFTRRREEGMPFREAARAAGVSYRTARTYERERLAGTGQQQRGEERHG